jgi:hypothetical protein
MAWLKNNKVTMIDDDVLTFDGVVLVSLQEEDGEPEAAHHRGDPVEMGKWVEKFGRAKILVACFHHHDDPSAFHNCIIVATVATASDSAPLQLLASYTGADY